MSPAVEDTDSSRRGRDSERGSTYTTSNSVTSASNSSEDTPRFLDLNNLSVDKIAQLKALGIL